jgi:hypothetical protein
MAEEWCDHCDLPRAQCPHGNPEADDQPKGYRVTRDCTGGDDGPTIEARIPGECVGCLDPIEPGDWIRHVPEGWVHSPPKEQARRPQTDSSIFEGVD